jgi:7-carboxy-7-deazaguanine synthase
VRLSEVYTSVQGEGPNTGDPTTFVRFGGCNLRCPGWGFGKLPDGTEVPGCDTVFAVYPEWRKTWEGQTSQEVFAKVPPSPKRICLTGGEPLIQPKKEMENLVDLLIRSGHVIDIFTNGTQLLPDWARETEVTVCMDWKLPGAGEVEGESFLRENLERVQFKDMIKFVVKDRADFEVALERARQVNTAQIWFGPVWRVMDPGILAGWIANEFPEGNLNIQTHKYIWDPDERRR